jgi:hypothetical protein
MVAFMATFPLPRLPRRLPRPAYLYCNILPVRLYVLGEVLRAGLCAGLRNFAFLTQKIARHAWRFFFSADCY